MLSQIEIADYSIVELDGTEYNIVGLCTNGSKHYSETLLSLNDAYDTFDLYKSLVKNLGGGTVELIARRGDISIVLCPTIV